MNLTSGSIVTNGSVTFIHVCMTHNIANTKESLQNIVRFKSMTYIFIQAVLMFNYFRTSIYKTGAKELNIRI